MATAPAPPAVQVFTTLRYDKELKDYKDNNEVSRAHNASFLYMLRYHQERMVEAAQALMWPATSMIRISGETGIRYLDTTLKNHVSRTYRNENPNHLSLRIRITMNDLGDLDITSAPCAPVVNFTPFPTDLTTCIPRMPQLWKIQLGYEPILPSNYTKFKTTHRAHYDAARAHLTPDQLNVEVLIFNQNNELMEGTLSTPYLFRGNKWITPAHTCGGNTGTTRRWALENGICDLGVIKREGIKHGELVWLSNGVRGFGWGVVELDEGKELEMKRKVAEKVAKEANRAKVEGIKAEMAKARKEREEAGQAAAGEDDVEVDNPRKRKRDRDDVGEAEE